MIRYGLKLWSNNHGWLDEAVQLAREGKIDFIELYHNAHKPLDYEYLKTLKGACPITIHNTHDSGFHELIIGDEQVTIWGKTVELANFFGSKWIIVHPGKNHTFESFREELVKIDDPRILVENMAGLDIYGDPMFGQTLEELKAIHALKPICFDFQKAVKAATHQDLDYKNFIGEALKELDPFYFHISGGDAGVAMDEHKDLWDSNIDFGWIKEILTQKSKDREIHIVFETPKREEALANDQKNMDYFKRLTSLKTPQS